MRGFLLSMGWLPFKPWVRRERKGTYGTYQILSGRKFITERRNGEGYNLRVGEYKFKGKHIAV